MKKRSCKRAVCLCAAGIAFCQPFTSYGAWQAHGTRWQYRQENTEEPLRSVWHETEGSWYRFDDAGFMVTGWYRDTDDRWYFLNPVSGGNQGEMMTGWQWIDGYCYYLSEKGSKEHPLGSMYVNEKTPDGYPVDATGAWTDENGKQIHVQGKGIITKSGAGVAESRKERSPGKGTGSFGGGSRSPGGGSTSPGQGGNTGITSESDSNLPDSGETALDGKSQDTDHSEDKNIDVIPDTGKGTDQGAGQGTTPDTGQKAGQGTARDTGQQAGQGTAPTTDQDTSQATAQETEASTATTSNASKNKVSWNVYFTDSSTHQTHLAPKRSGSIEEGDYLTIYFQTQITDAQGRIWKSREQSPYVVPITGPQNRIIYMEYTQEGEVKKEEDPWKNERNTLNKWLNLARKEEGAFTGTLPEEIPYTRFLITDKKSCDLRLLSAASHLDEGQTRTLYIIGKNYVPEGSALAEVSKDDVEYSHITEQELQMEDDIYTLARFQLTRREQGASDTHVWTGSEKRHWNIGDIQERTLGGIPYRFRCIDPDYGDDTDKKNRKALFLCDTVIPADMGSEYIFEQSEDGTYGYRFSPGPVTSFGENNSYKHSHIRRWLQGQKEEFGEAEEISTGVIYAYEGSTEPGSGEQLRTETLKSRYLGSQSMTDRLFILSLDEALQYRRWLWRFEGSEEENPKSQTGTFCKSYWLRTPGEKEDQVYTVDLVQKNLHPQTVEIPDDKEDPELAVTGSTGVRPAFAVPQY